MMLAYDMSAETRDGRTLHHLTIPADAPKKVHEFAGKFAHVGLLSMARVEHKGTECVRYTFDAMHLAVSVATFRVAHIPHVSGL
jgi:hypothetical protein